MLFVGLMQVFCQTMPSEKDQYKELCHTRQQVKIAQDPPLLPKFSLEEEAEVKDHADSWIRGSGQRRSQGGVWGRRPPLPQDSKEKIKGAG